MELNELEAMHARNPPPPTPEPESETDWVDPDDQALIDIKEAINLFTTVKTVLDYVSNPMICRAISRRERENMSNVSEHVRQYLASVEPTYNEETE